MKRQASASSTSTTAPKLADPKPVRQHAGPDHRDGRGRGAKGIDPAPCTVRQRKLRLNDTRKDRNEEGLPKA